MSRAARDFGAKARAAWGDVLPDWIETIADEATRTSASAVAARLGYSAPVISEVLANRYKGDVAGVEQAVRGVYLGAVVGCPVLGEIRRQGMTVDLVCHEYYGSTAGHTERVLQANPGLAALGPVLPPGTRVKMHDRPSLATPAVPSIALWS